VSEAPALLRVTARAPQPGDVRALEAAERACFSDPWPSHLFLAEIYAPGRFHRILVEPAGYLVAYLLCAWQYLDLHVLKVATLPSYRRIGLARRLMTLAEEHARASAGESVTLEVRESNLEAIALYRNLGFLPVGRRPQYYGDGEDALVMTKRMVDLGDG
jgi:[ribosomal protein S18]-alanine N-acetyltransferase